jgi:hypothetical protein
LASSVPTTNLGKILGQTEELESANLVDIYSADPCLSKIEEDPRWTDWGMPAKRGDLGWPIITITIGAYTFKKPLCDFGSSVNIMPKVIYKKINGSPLLYTTMCLLLTQNMHPTPNTQQAEQSWLHARKESRDVPVNFS